MSRTALRRRGAAAVAAIPVAFVVSLSTGLPTAGAASTDTVLPVPIVGLATGPTGLPGPLLAHHVTARTDPAAPGTTAFLGTETPYCLCVVHWRNLTTGAAGVWHSTYALTPSPTHVAQTGSGILVATVTAGGAPGYPLTPATLLPGGGTWTVP